MAKKHHSKVHDKEHDIEHDTEDGEMEEGHIGDKIMDILQSEHPMEHKHKALMALHKKTHDNMGNDVEEGKRGITKSAMDEHEGE